MRSVAISCLGSSAMALKIRLVRWFGVSGIGWLSGSGSRRSDLVDRMFCRCWCRWPLMEGMDLGRCLRTRSDVRPGHVAK